MPYPMSLQNALRGARLCCRSEVSMYRPSGVHSRVIFSEDSIRRGCVRHDHGDHDDLPGGFDLRVRCVDETSDYFSATTVLRRTPTP